MKQTSVMRYALTLAAFLVVTLGAMVALLATDSAGPTSGVLAVAAYMCGCGLIIGGRRSFDRLNQTAAPAWLWVLVGVVPVVAAGLIPHGNVGTALACAFLGVLAGAAWIAPRGTTERRVGPPR